MIVAGVIAQCGRPLQWIMEAWIKRRLILVTCPSVTEEDEQVLKRPNIRKKCRVADEVIHLIGT